MEAERSNLLPFGIILIVTSEFDLDSHDVKGPPAPGSAGRRRAVLGWLVKVWGYQRYQRRPSPARIANPSSQAIRTIAATHQRACRTKPNPPNRIARISTSRIRAMVALLVCGSVRSTATRARGLKRGSAAADRLAESESRWCYAEGP